MKGDKTGSHIQLLCNFILLRSNIFEKCVILRVFTWVLSGELSEVHSESRITSENIIEEITFSDISGRDADLVHITM